MHLRMLDCFGAEASVGGINNTSIIVRQSPSKVAVLEEFYTELNLDLE